MRFNMLLKSVLKCKQISDIELMIFFLKTDGLNGFSSIEAQDTLCRFLTFIIFFLMRVCHMAIFHLVCP